jgi:uncharacterized protein (DUF2252 family)
MISADPLLLARRQLESDRTRTARFPALLARKITRMTASPLAFLRGAAPLFYELLAAHPTLAEGPRGKGWIVGDLHIENFGAYRPDPLAEKAARSRVAFNLNDFDDAVVGPWRYDVLRLTTSLLLAGRELGASGPRALDLCARMIASYVGAAFHGERAPRRPPVVAALAERVAQRTRRALLDARTTLVGGERRFVRGERYRDLERPSPKKVQRAVDEYAQGLDERDRLRKDERVVLDFALRVAGTGSLGGLRIAVLLRGKGGPDGAWIFDMKEQGVPSPAALVRRSALAPAPRVVTAFRAAIPEPPRLLGTATLDGLSMFVRKLTPQEDRLDLSNLLDPDLDPLATYLGALVGEAHARARTALLGSERPVAPWSAAEQEQMLDRAIAIAGIHESTYLALCRLTGERGEKHARAAPTARKRRRAK